ncbi:MAG: hypothetical protein MJ213_01250 [Bacilli bacterium]|nr:hypothetical protein [Bacilli bacterium]
MNKKISLLSVASLLSIVALASCAGETKLDTQYRVQLTNCYAKDRTHGRFAPEAYEFGYVGTHDTSHIGSYTVTSGSEIVKPGEDCNMTIKLDPFVVMNPVALTTDPTPSFKYCLIYVLDNKFEEYDLLPANCYTFAQNPEDATEWNLRIDKKYMYCSYGVYFSASYYQVPLGRPFVSLAEDQNFINAVMNTPYINNTHVNDDFTFTLFPKSMNTGVNFYLNDFYNKFVFTGIQGGKKVDITNYITLTNSQIMSQIPGGKGERQKTYNYSLTDSYALKCKLPMLAKDSSGKDYGLCKFDAATGKYGLNYEGILVSLSDKNIDALPMNDFLKRVKINDGTSLQVKGSPTIVFGDDSNKLSVDPVLVIPLTIKEGAEVDVPFAGMSVSSYAGLTKNYFADLEISDKLIDSAWEDRFEYNKNNFNALSDYCSLDAENAQILINLTALPVFTQVAPDSEGIKVGESQSTDKKIASGSLDFVKELNITLK